MGLFTKDLKNMIGKLYKFELVGSGNFPAWVLSECKGYPETREDSERIIKSSMGKRTVTIVSQYKPNEVVLGSFGWKAYLTQDADYTKDNCSEYHTWPC